MAVSVTVCMLEADSGTNGHGEGHPFCPDFLTVSQARALQQQLAPLVRGAPPVDGPLATVAGADVSYSRRGGKMWAAVVVCAMPGLEVIETAVVADKQRFPYIPGLLSFREGPVLLKAFALLRARPDVVLFDGQGSAHPCGLGLASHMGLCLNVPTVGCAKSRLVGEHGLLGAEKGTYEWLILEGQRIGAALRTRAGAKPVYVSPGYRMSVERAIEVVMATCTHCRIPEPLREAHLVANKQRSFEE